MMVPALLITAAYWFSSARPLPYESKAIYQFVTSDHGTSLFNKNPTLPTYMTATEQTVVLSQMSLKMLSENLNLPTRWSITEEQVLDILKKSTTARTVPSTDLMELSVKLSSPEDSRDIAQGLVKVHQKRRNDVTVTMANDFMKELEIAVLDQSDVVEEKRKLRDSLVRRLPDEVQIQIHIVNNIEEIKNPFDLLVEEHKNVESSLTEIDALIELITRRVDEESFDFVVTLLTASDELQTLHAHYQSQIKLLAQLRKAGDASVDSQTIVLETLRRQLSESVTSHQKSLRQKRDAKSARLKVILQSLEEAKDITFTHRVLLTSVQSAHKDFVTHLQLLESMRMKISTLRIQTQLPQEALIMHEVPQLGRPTRPTLTPLILSALSAVGIVMGFMVALMLEYLAFSRSKLRETPSIS